MIRQITTLKPPPPPKVDPKANAEQVTRLQAEATKLQNEIRLANKMGESDAAASARQRLKQVNAELTTAQPTPLATQPGPVQPAAVNAANGNGGTTAAPALFTTQNFGGTPNLLPTSGGPDGGAISPEVTAANDILRAIEGGKSIDNIAEEREMKPEEVVAALNAGGMTATSTQYANGDTRQTVITDGSGRTITENQDYHHGGYYTEVKGPNGPTTTSPIRDDLGRTETTSVDPETGAITTRHVADLGDGAVTERTSNPETGITTTTHTAADGAVTVTKNLPNGAKVETVTPAGGPALPVTTVTGPDGKETILAHTQAADGSGAPSIQGQLAEGKSIDEIAEVGNLTPEQVIAELNAAGLEVTRGGAANGETISTTVTDPHTGKKTTYNHDYEHGSTSVTTVEGNTETTDTVDGNGRTSHTVRNTETGEQTTTIVDPKNNTETTIVFDKEGRRTETIVETLNDGEPIDYEVKPGDNLSDIAEAHGVTLQDLAKSNPELFNTPRDPDLIHPGETVVIEGGTKTTVKVTFNGYTLTTHPDGNMTLLNHAEGTELKFEAGSALDGLSNLLLDANPNSSDPEEAKEGQTIKTAVEMVLYGENLSNLGETAEQREQETLAAVEEYGIGNPGEKVPGVSGAKPQGKAPSGGDWVQARGLWVDPHIARAMAAEDVAKSALVEIPAKINQLSAQLDVYAHDPAYNGALKAADAQLDKILAPYGLEWNPPETKGTLADANTRLTEANTRLKEASDASAAYQEAVTLLDRAIRQQEYAAQFPDGTHPVAVAAGSDYNYQEEVRKGDLARAAANTLFAEASAQTSKGDKLLADHQVGNLTTALNEAIDKHGGAVLEVPEGTLKPGEQPVEIEVAGTKLRVAPEVAEAYNNGDQGAITASGKAAAIQIDGEWKWVHPEVAAATIELDAAKKQQSHAEKNLGVAQAYANVAVTGQEVAEFDDLKARLIEQYRLENPDHFIPDKEYSSAGGDYYGKITSREVIEKDGDLYLVLKFEHDDYVQEQQLTSISGSEDDPESARNNPLNEEWRALWYGSDPQACGTDGLAANGGLEGLKTAQISAGEQAKNAEIARFDLSIEDINTEITNLTETRDAAVTEHGAGTTEAPEGALPPGVAPVEITVDGRKLYVAPEVAEAFNQGKPGALSDGVKAVQIEIDGQWKWVHPEVAAAEMELDAAEQEKKNLEENRQIAVVARDGYSFALKQPVKIFADQESAAKEEARLQYTYLEEDRDNALANYQLQFQSLYEQGYTEDFRPVEDLNSEVTKIFELDTTTEEGRESLEKITEEVRDIAGENASIRAVPMFFIDETTTPQKVVLLAVQDGDGVRYVDVKGGAYGNVGEFQDNNDLFGEEGKLILPKDFNMKPGADGKIALDVIQPREFSTWETIADPIVGIGTGLATIASFTPLAPVAAPLAYAGGAYLATRAVFKQVDHLKYGGEWGETESLMNVATVATTALPMGSSLMRTAGLARTGMSGGKAFAGSLGISRSADDGFFSFGRYGKIMPSSQQLKSSMELMRTAPGSLKWAAWTMDAGAMAMGAPLLYVSARDLYLHGSEMSGLDLANAITGLAAGVTGTGLGLRGLKTMFPGKGGQTSALSPNSPVPVAPGAHGQQPPRPGAAPHGGTPPLGVGPAGPKPAPGGEIVPRNGEIGKPMVVHEQGPDRVYHPTENIVFHDPRHRVVEGTATNVHDDGVPAPGVRGDPENASDRSTQERRDRNVGQPADGDPIVVPPVRDGATTQPAESGFRLVWDPQTKTFIGMPRPDPADYVYTRGKDPQQTGYLDGWRPSDPAVKFTPEELLLRSETETRDGSSRATTGREGTSGVQPPQKSLQIRDANGETVTVTYLGPPPRSAENVYVPPAEGPRLRGDDPTLANKSHILVRDPETGEPVVLPWIRGASENHVPGGSGRHDDPASAYEAAMQALGAGPQHKALEAAPPTTYTLDQVRGMRQPHKWRAGELYTRELNRSPGEEHFPVPADPTGPYPVTGSGGRFVDAPVHNARGDIEAIEVKTYHRWTTINGKSQMREVPLTEHLRQQINKDVALRESTPGYEPRWVFLDAPPSPELQKALDDARIVGNIMGHNKPSKARTKTGTIPSKAADETSGPSILTGGERVANREEALRLLDGMIAQDLKLPDVTIIDLADQFSRSPKLMDMLRSAHDADVRIVNAGRPDLHIQTTDGQDVTFRGASYDHRTRVITLDSDMVGGAAGRDEMAAKYVQVLVHELSHFADPKMPRPAEYGTEGAFTQAYTDARLLNEGRARLAEFIGAEEVSANGGQALHGLDDVSAAETAVFENFKAGRIDEATAARQLGELFRTKLRSDTGTTYGAFYENAAKAIWARPAVEGSGVDAFGRPAGLDGASAAPAANPGPAKPSGKLTRGGVRAVPLDQVQTLNISDFQPNHVAWLKREQVAKLTDQQFRDMDRLGLLPHMTKSQLRGIPKTRIGDLNVAGLTAQQIPWLTNGQVGKLSEQQFRDLGAADLTHHLTKSQLQAIAGDRIGFLDVSTLDAKQVPWLKPKQVANLTQKQLGDMSESGALALLSREQLRAIPETDVGVINPAKLDAKQVPWLTEGQVSQLTEKQLQALGEAGLLKHLTQNQVRAVPDTRIGAVDVTKLDSSQVPWLTGKQVAKLTEQQFKDLGEADLLKKFTENQVKAIPAERLDVAKLDPTQVPWLTDKQIAALTRDQWAAFTVNHIEALTRPQIEAMTPKQFEELSPGQFRKFTLEQFEWMSTDQANALSVLQLTTFKAAHKKTMTPDQRTLVEGALVYSRTKEYQIALDTFGTMAGSSYMLWSSLPPHWTATAGGVMFALRGAIFSAQSIFPNATASHTKLGRALNLASGLSFIATSPSAGAPLFQSGTNPLVNGTFTLGNMIYGTKSTLQAFAGRPVLRLLGDHVGNFAYLSGSIAYTAQNLHSPLGWISGGLFALGSAEFWASGIRADVLNRKSPPRTDAEVAAAAKSDKRWATWDRLALGITFGIGMFLFAWDTLDGQPWKVDATEGKKPPKPDETPGPDDDVTGPDDTPDDPQEPPEQFPQLVVLSEDGLNLRAQPDADSDKVTVLEPGTFVEQTGRPTNDPSGRVWIPVEGFGTDGNAHTGWVAGEYVGPHPEGASNPEGRINPALEQRGYRWVEAREGDRIRVIANANSADVAETVVLNMDHILSPDVIFPGDRIYLPG